MKLNGKEIVKYIHNSIDIRFSEDGGIIPYRFTPEQILKYRKLSTNMDFEIRAISSSNITLDFETDSEIFGLEYNAELCVDKGFMSFDLLVNGRLYSSEHITNFKTGLIAFRIPKGLKHVQLFFPWNAKIEIRNIIIDDGSVINPICYNKRIIAFGDSITQGFIVEHPSLSYVGRVTNLYDAEVLNQGVGGFFFNEESLDCNLKKYNPDCIILGYGTNDAAYSDDLNLITKNQKNYLERLRNLFPDKRIMAFLPIWGNGSGLKARDIVRSFNHQDVNRELAETYSKYGVEVVRDNFFPGMNDFYAPDCVHPNDTGGILMGDEILSVLRKI